MRRFLLAGVAALTLTGCTAFEDGPATVPGGALYRVAERLAASGDAATAATLYRSAIAMGNATPDARRGYGNVLLALGQPQAAIEQYEAALAQVKDARLYNGLGIAYDMLGDHERAQERFREGLALAPDNKGLAHNYGLSLAAADAPDKEKAPAAAEAAPEQPAEPAPVTAALRPVPQEEPKPVARPAAVPSVIPTMRPKPVAMMRDSLPEPVSPQVTPMFRPVAMQGWVSEPVAPQRIETPAPTPEPEVVPVSEATPEAAPPPFTRVNEIVPLSRPVAATTLYGGYFRVRLAGYASRERAMESRREIVRQAPELHDAVRVVEERPSLATGVQPRYTLITAPLPSRRAAEAACETLSERGLACLAEPATSPLTLRS